MEKLDKGVNICESCKKEKNVTNIDGHLLCEECSEEIVKCDFCGNFLGVNYDALTEGNFGKLRVPELSLPDQMTNVVFCNIEHLEKYLEKYKEEGHACIC